MNKKTSISAIVYSFLLASLLLIPLNAIADTKTLPGSHCDVRGGNFSYNKQFGSIINNNSVGVFYTCSVLRDKTNTAPIKTLQVKVNRPTSASNFSCFFVSRRANGNSIQSKSRTTNKAGISTLTVKNLQTANKSTVDITCGLPSQARILSIFWNE